MRDLVLEQEHFNRGIDKALTVLDYMSARTKDDLMLAVGTEQRGRADARCQAIKDARDEIERARLR